MRKPVFNPLGRFMRNEDGATAVEFGLVVTPFLLFAFGIINVGNYYYQVNNLDKGVDMAARKVRTGEAQKSAMTVGQFKTLICTSGLSWLDCGSNLQILMQSADEWSGLQAQSCQSNGTLTQGTGQSADSLQTYSGTQGKVVLVTACYRWELPKYLPFFKIGKLADGSMLLQSSTSFRTEPYI